LYRFNHKIYAGWVLSTVVFAIMMTAIPAAGYTGQCAFDFVNIPIGANSSSLGQINYAGLLGPQALFGNPALIGESNGFFFSHQEHFLDTRTEAAGFSLRLNNSYSIGLAANFFSPGAIEGYNTENNRIENVAAGDHMLKAAFARSGRISIGGYLAYYRQRLDDFKMDGFGLGLGIGYDHQWGRSSLAIDNIGPNIKSENNSYPLPLKFTLSNLLPIHNMIDINTDLSYGRNNGLVLSGGLQYNLISGFNLRAGANSDNPFSMGCGMLIGDFTLDYSYLPISDFGDRHIFSVTILR